MAGGRAREDSLRMRRLHVDKLAAETLLREREMSHGDC
jgi:hypothetical protein